MSSKMSVFQDKLQDFFLPLVEKMDNNKHLSALKSGMVMTVPLTIIGGFFMLLAQPPVNPNTLQGTNFFFSFLLSWHAWAQANIGFLLLPFNLTIGLLSVYVVIAITYVLAKSYGINELTTAFTALLVFLVTSVKVVNGEFGSAITSGILGAQGLFYAIIVAFVVVEVTRFLLAKNIKIKLPEQVPPMVAAPFEALIPAVALTVGFILLNVVCVDATGDSLARLVYTILIPLMTAGSSLPSAIIMSILLSLLWFFGIHGNNVLGAVLTPLTTANLALNAEFYINGTGKAIPLAGGFMTLFGNWMSYPAMVLVLFLVAKSAHLRSIRKVAVVPDQFNINEPLTFGVPVVMNVLIALPLMLANIVTVTIAYLVMNAGLVNAPYIPVPWTTPGILNLFLSTGDIRSVMLWIILFVLDIIILLPFIKAYDNQLLAKEKVEANK